MAKANDGSFDAMMKLGLAYDQGAGVEIDRRKALDWYLRAATAGDPDAQFNAAVMMDAGVVDGADDLQTALHWYTRAATNGQVRAQYNLGLIYAQGDGVEKNTAIARYWFAKAAEQLPAAKSKLASLPIDGFVAEVSVPPHPSAGLVKIDMGLFAEMTWVAPPGPKGSFFEIEVLAWVSDLAGWSQPIFKDSTFGNGVVAFLNVESDLFAWRVEMIEPDFFKSKSSTWMLMGQGDQELPIDLRLSPETNDAFSYEIIAGRIKDAMDNIP